MVRSIFLCIEAHIFTLRIYLVAHVREHATKEQLHTGRFLDGVDKNKEKDKEERDKKRNAKPEKRDREGNSAQKEEVRRSRAARRILLKAYGKRKPKP